MRGPTGEQRLRFVQATARAMQPSLRQEPLAPQEIKALCYDLQAVTEATLHLDAAIRERHPEVPWRSVEALRNHLAHDHPYVEPAAVGLAAQALVPVLDRMATNELSLAASLRRRQQRSADVGLGL